MYETSLSVMFLYLIILILLSGFFSGSEIGMMSINRYKLKHLAKKNNDAKRVHELLNQPDRLLGIILIGNTFANICASAVATIIGTTLFGEIGVILATVVLTLVILIVSEVSPKTVAAIYPEKIAFFASRILNLMLYIFGPMVTLVNAISNKLILIFGIKINANKRNEQLSTDELKSVINESAGQVSNAKKNMMVRILDLEQVCIEEIMIPRSEVIGIDINNDFRDIVEQLAISQHTFLPVYKDDIQELIGVLHLRVALNLMASKHFSKEEMLKIVDEAYFVPEGTPLNAQLLNFQQQKKRFGFIVDEYGDILGIITLEDILEEIVGEYTTNITQVIQEVYKQKDNSYICEGSISLRHLRRLTKIEFNNTNARTLSGLIVEHLQMLPEVGVCILLNSYVIEVIKIEDNMVKSAKVFSK